MTDFIERWTPQPVLLALCVWVCQRNVNRAQALVNSFVALGSDVPTARLVEAFVLLRERQDELAEARLEQCRLVLA